jgi:hypothetical protein
LKAARAGDPATQLRLIARAARTSEKTWGRKLSKIDILRRPTKQDWANQFQIRKAGPTSPALLFLRIPDAAIVDREAEGTIRMAREKAGTPWRKAVTSSACFTVEF